MFSKKETSAENLDVIINDNMPTYDYPYLINSYQLMASENNYIKQLHVLGDFSSKLVIANEAPTTITSLHTDTTRNIKISNHNISDLNEKETYETIVNTFGEHAQNIIDHHNQNVSYLVLTPVQQYFMEGNYLLQTANDTKEDIFLYGDSTPIRTVEIESAYVRVPEDPNFILDEKLALIAKGHPKKTPEEYRRDIELAWKGAWKFKYNCKVLARPTSDGYEILGIGTDNPLVASAYLGSEKMTKLVGDMLDTTLEIEASTQKFLKKMQAKLPLASGIQIEMISRKIVNLQLVLEKVKLFKNGELSFPQFVKAIGDLSRISQDIQHTGMLSVPINNFLNTLGLHKDSGTTGLLKKNALKLEEIFSQMLTDAEPLLRSEKNDTSKELAFKEKFNSVEEAIKDYLANRINSLPLLSKTFDSERGNLRAHAYISLLESAQTPLGQALVIYALLNGRGKELKSRVVGVFTPTTESEIKENLMQVIKTALPGDLAHASAISIASSIIEKAESNKKANFNDEIKSLNILEVGTQQRRSNR